MNPAYPCIGDFKGEALSRLYPNRYLALADFLPGPRLLHPDNLHQAQGSNIRENAGLLHMNGKYMTNGRW